MIEPFEVGVSIALGDGVLEAVGKAHRDLAQLQAGLKSAGPSVQQLRQMARRAVGLTTPAEAVERRVERIAMSAHSAAEKPPIAPRDAEPAVADAARDGAPGAPRMTMPLQMTLMPASAMPVKGIEGGGRQMNTPLTSLMPRETAERLTAPLRSSVRSLPDSEVLKAIPEGESIRSSLGRLSPSGELMPQMASVRSAPMAITAAPSASALQPLPAMAPRAAPLMQPADAASPGHQRSFVSPQSVAPRVDVAQASGARALPGEDPGQLQEHLAVSTAVAPARTPNAGAAASAGRTVQSEAPASSGQGQVATQQFGGDVMLDGMMVGKWLSRHLNRQAIRAASGPTAFDARRGRLLPGATVGA